MGEPERVQLACLRLHDEIEASQRSRQTRAEQRVPVKHDGAEPDEIVDAPGYDRRVDDGRRAGGRVLHEIDYLRDDLLAV